MGNSIGSMAGFVFTDCMLTAPFIGAVVGQLENLVKFLTETRLGRTFAAVARQVSAVSRVREAVCQMQRDLVWTKDSWLK